MQAYAKKVTIQFSHSNLVFAEDHTRVIVFVPGEEEEEEKEELFELKPRRGGTARSRKRIGTTDNDSDFNLDYLFSFANSEQPPAPSDVASEGVVAAAGSPRRAKPRMASLPFDEDGKEPPAWEDLPKQASMRRQQLKRNFAIGGNVSPRENEVDSMRGNKGSLILGEALDGDHGGSSSKSGEENATSSSVAIPATEDVGATTRSPPTDKRDTTSPSGTRKNITPGMVATYVNANWVDGARGQRYICTQAPLPETFLDFWLMVWQHSMLSHFFFCNTREFFFFHE